MLIQENTDWWKTEPPTPTPNVDHTLDEEEEDKEEEVEKLDSLGCLHNELADADSSQEQIGTKKVGETEVTPSASVSETLKRR